MPNVSHFGTQTDNAVVQGTVTDRAMVIPDIPPQGLMGVGPRVTPHFVKPSLWSALTTYHFFDAVRDAAGNAYVAIKQVIPEGTPLTDEDYWFLWADPDARFDDLNEIVKTFNRRITAAQATGDDALKKINSLETIVKDGIYLCLGDSWVAGGEIGAIIARQKNLRLVNKAVSGASFTQYDTYISTVSEQIDAALREISNPSLVKFITVVCSVNDVSHHSTTTQGQINTEFAKAIKKLKNAFPNAEIVFAADAPYSSDFQSLSYYYYNVSQLQIASMYQSVTFVNLLNMFNNKDFYKDDNLHPNNVGYGHVASMLLGGRYIAQNIITENHGDDTLTFFFNGNEVFVNYVFAPGEVRDIKFNRYFALRLNFTNPRIGDAPSYKSDNCATVDYKNVITAPASESKLYGFIYGTLI